MSECPLSSLEELPIALRSEGSAYYGPEQNKELATWLLTHELDDFEGSPPVIHLPGFGPLDANELVDLRLSRREELDARILAQRELAASSTGDQLICARGDLALALNERYACFGTFDLLMEAIALFEEMLASDLSIDPAQHNRLLNGLGESLCSRFKQQTDIADYERSLAAYKSSLQLCEATTEIRLSSLLGMGIAKFWSITFGNWSRSQKISETESAVSILEHAMVLSSSTQPIEAECRLYLSIHLERYQIRRVYEPCLHLKDCVASIQRHSFVELALIWCWHTLSSGNESNYLDALLVAHVVNYVSQRTGHSEEHFLWYILSHLATAYARLNPQHRYNGICGSLCLLWPRTHYYRPRSILFQSIHLRLSALLSEAYTMTGNLIYLEEKISCLSNLGSQSVLRRPALNNLALSLLMRYDVLHKIEDLQKSTELLERCVPGDKLVLGECIYAHNLGDCYVALSRFHQGDVGLVNKGIALFKACLQTRTAFGQLGDEYHAVAASLVIGLCERFELQGDASDLEEGISVAINALLHRSDALEIMKRVSSALALARRHLGLARKDFTLLQSALRGHIYSLSMLPVEHSSYGNALGEQAVTRAHLWRMTRKNLHFFACVATFRQLMQNKYSRPSDRLVFSAPWIDVCTEFGNPRLISGAFHEILQLLSRAMPLDWSSQGRLAPLQTLSAFASRAALHFLTQGEVAHAIEHLEGGRSILWSRSLLLRQDFSRVPPKMGERLHLLAQSLQQTVEDKNAILRRRQNSDEFDRLIDDIRHLPNMHSFMRPATYDRLCHVSSQGPLLIFLGNDAQSFAVIASSPASDPISITLPHTNTATLVRMASTVNDSSVRARDRLGRRGNEGRKMSNPRRPRMKTIEKVLAEMWNTIMKPVVQFLGLEDKVKRTRVWILPVGSFALLPLHAAGIYFGNDQECLSDYCVPSYIPSMQALSRARHNAPPPTPRRAKFMMVAEPGAPALPPLLNTVPEIRSIATLLAGAAPVTTIIGGTKVGDVAEHMLMASIVHLACHGQQDRAEPLQSGFMLGDGKLTVSRLMSLQLQNASVAFLSACESAMGDKNLPDEAIHLSAAMLFIGFRSVIGTMWSMHDVDGPQVMKKIYEALLDAGDEATYDVIPRALEDSYGHVKMGTREFAHGHRVRR